MAFDLGHLITLLLVLYIVSISYKKKTGNNISELWQSWKTKAVEKINEPDYRRVYVTKGIKQ